MSQESLIASQFTNMNNRNHTTAKNRSSMINLHSNDTLLRMSGINNGKTNFIVKAEKPCCQTKGKSNVLLNIMGGSPIKLEADNKPCCGKGTENKNQIKNLPHKQSESSCSSGNCEKFQLPIEIQNKKYKIYNLDDPYDCRPNGLTDFMYPCDLFECLSEYKNINEKGEFLIELPSIGQIAVDLSKCCQNLNYALYCITDFKQFIEIEKLFKECIKNEIMKVVNQKIPRIRRTVHGFIRDDLKSFNYILKMTLIQGKISSLINNNELLVSPSIRFGDKINSIIAHNIKYSHLNCICNKKSKKQNLFCLDCNDNCGKFKNICKDEKGNNKNLCNSVIFKNTPFFEFTSKEILFDFEFLSPTGQHYTSEKGCKFILSNLKDENLNNTNNKENFSFKVLSYNSKNDEFNSFQYNNYPLFDKENNNEFKNINNKRYIPIRIPLDEDYKVEFDLITNCCCRPRSNQNISRFKINFILTNKDLTGLNGIINLKIDINGNFSINNKIIKRFSYKSDCTYTC